MGDPWRQTGRTTRQLQDAPENAVFVWPVASSMAYVLDLTYAIGRTKITVCSIEAFLMTPSLCKGRHVVFDHSCKEKATTQQREQLRHLGYVLHY